jgi:hypothetical protein
MRGPLCKVCTSPLRTNIDRDMLSGMSLRQVSEKYGYTRSTLHNHKLRCQGIPASKGMPRPHTPETDALARQKRKDLAAPSRIAALEAALPTREELGASLEDVIYRLDRIISKHEQDDGTDAIALKGLGEMRSTIDALAKLAGHVGAGSTDRSVHVNVGVAISAADIASSLSAHLGTVSRSQAIEAMKTIEAMPNE